jgi:Zn-dependent protease with chaperone function
MVLALVGALYIPVAVWLATAVALLVAFRRSAPPILLRLAAAFLALWALLATTTLVWILSNGGWTAALALARAPAQLFEPRWWPLWIAGAVGAFVVFAIAFALSQMVGRGFLSLLNPRRLPWPAALPRHRVTTSLLLFASPSLEAFSFAAVEWGERHRLVRHEYILLSSGLRDRLAPEEWEAAIAHELGHLRSLDGRYLTFMRTLARMMRWDPVIAYLAATLTRREEYRADAEAVRLTGQPLALARALYKASGYAGLATPPGTMGFLGGQGRHARSDTMERIRRLVALAESAEFQEGPRGPS